ncbi:MAG: hypothetical protein ACRCXZ_06420 [Patescibacteria group bacterium]
MKKDYSIQLKFKVMSKQLALLTNIVEECSKEHLQSVFSPILNLPDTSTKAEMISHCLNTELGAYGFKSYPSPDKTMVLVNDETMCHIADFFHGKGFIPVLTKEQVDRVKTIHKVSNDNNITIYWDQTGFRRTYYYLKQYGFNGINLYNVINMNTANGAIAALSPTGAAGLTMAGILALSWSGSLFFSTVENYIPTSMPKAKTVVGGLKFVVALPVRWTEWTANKVFSIPEMFLLGTPLPTNITQVYRLHVGPKIEDLGSIKNSVIKWLLKRLDN